MKYRFVAVCALAGMLAGTGRLLGQGQGQWNLTGSLQLPRQQGTQVAISGGNVLAMGGVDGSNATLASAEIYRAAKGTWSLTGSMQVARELFPAVVLANGHVLVSGGLGAAGALLGGAELFNPASGTWTPAGSMAASRYGHTATLLADGRVLVAGGCTATNCATSTPAAEIYDPATNGWTTTGNLGMARGYHSAVRLGDGAVLAIGGFAGSALTSCELYDPGTGTWSAAASTSVARFLNGTTLLPDGKILVTGGAHGKYPDNSAELYDPAGKVWTAAGNMAVARYAHSSTLLSDGSVMLAGGVAQPYSCGKDCVGFIPTAAAEIFTESAASFAAASSLSRALAYQASTALGNGRALVDIGSDAELYAPLTMRFTSQSLNFGFLQLGLTSPPQSVTVTNVSSHPAVFAGVSSFGDFTQHNTCPGTLAPGQACSVTASFTPAAAGPRHGGVTLRDNDPGSPKQIIALSGVGETLALGVSPASLDLGSVAAGSSSTQTATLVNDGASPVTITGITVAPANHTFVQTNDCLATLAVQQACALRIVFTPPDVFAYRATLSVANSAGSPATLQLTGTGIDGS